MTFPKAKDDHYRRLVDVLGDGEWHKQENIEQHDAGLVGVVVRQVCNNHPDEFLGNVSYGYKLVEHATAEEIDWAINSLRSRARKISDRADKLESKNGGRLQPELF